MSYDRQTQEEKGLGATEVQHGCTPCKGSSLKRPEKCTGNTVLESNLKAVHCADDEPRIHVRPQCLPECSHLRLVKRNDAYV